MDEDVEGQGWQSALLAADPVSDPGRLQALQRVALLDTPTEESFDRLTRLAATVLHAPIALVSLVTDEKQFFKSCIGLPEPWASRRETPFSLSFCRHTVATGEPLIIEDARTHPLVQDSPGIAELGIVAYAGMPLTTSEGHVLGSFCVADHQPRIWTEEETAILRDLAASVVTQIELRTTARQTERTERILEEVIERVPTGIIVVDVEGKMVLMNREGREISGTLPESSLAVADQANAFQLYDPQSGEPLAPEETPIGRAVAGEEVTGQVYTFRRTASDAEVWIRAFAVPLRDTRDNVIGAVAVFADETREHRLERQRAEFVSAAAHDLKNPLTTIKGFAQILQRRLDRDGFLSVDKARDPLRQIEVTAARMTSLIGELQDAVRLRAGERLELRRAPVDLVAIVRRVADQQRQSTSIHEISVDARVPELVGNWDVDRLERVATNLVSNAVNYSPDGGPIVIGVERTDSCAVLRVTDPGIGVPADDLPHIFDRYYRASNAPEEVTGSGIGLAGVQLIVEQHGGSISVESEVGRGTTFIVRLPVSG